MDRSGTAKHKIQDALQQVRHLQQTIIEKQRFSGLSGPARICSGTAALGAAFIMSGHDYPSSVMAHIMGWGAVLVFASLLNGGALLNWFLRDPRVKRSPRRLQPILDGLPGLMVGAVLSALFYFNGCYDWLFGVWMCMFGLTNLAMRFVLPRAMIAVGLFYMVSGCLWLLLPDVSILNPWPMGLVFFIGEWAGGLVLYFDERRYLAFARYEAMEDLEHEGDSE